MTQQIITANYDDGSGNLYQRRETWAEAALHTVDTDVIDAAPATVNAQSASDGYVWIKIGDTTPPDGYTLDPDITDQQYNDWHIANDPDLN